MRRIIAVSGPVSSGKSTLATNLKKSLGDVRVFSTRELIREQLGTESERSALQRAGERLDSKTNGAWIAKALAAKTARGEFDEEFVVVDSVRIKQQVHGLRRAFGSRVSHIHLTAPDDELSRRYKKRRGKASRMKEMASYAAVRTNTTESQVDDLTKVADIVIDTNRCSPEDVLIRTAAHLGVYSNDRERLVDVLVGGQWGSEGKGHVASYLAPEYDVLMRVGGPNAGHKVFRESTPITYYQLPSGSAECEAHLAIGPGAVLNVDTLAKEIKRAKLDTNRLHIDPQAMIIEQQDIQFENAGLGGIGSTKQGVGSATARKVLRNAADPPVRLAKEIPDLNPFIEKSSDFLDRTFRNGRKVFLEGTQGTGLSLHHGDYPYVTSRETTVCGVLAEAGIPPSRLRRTLMLMRTYPIRVGGDEPSGPMGTPITVAEIARRSGLSSVKISKTERTSTTNRPRRIAEFNWSLLRQSTLLNGPTDIALSFTDYICAQNQDARRFEQLTPETINFIGEIERVAGAPVSLVVTRFSHSSRSIIDRRHWGSR